MKNIALLIVCTCLAACNTQPKTAAQVKPEVISGSLFAFKNIANTNIPYDTTIKYIELDSMQRGEYLYFALKNDRMGVDANYAKHFMTSRFIAKQQLIHGFTPIIIDAKGDDYSALFYIVIDSTKKLVSSLRIEGGLNAGPNHINDTLMQISGLQNFYLKGDTIISYNLYLTFNPVIQTQQGICDSVVYTSIINAQGKIQTHRTDSVRYKRTISMP